MNQPTAGFVDTGKFDPNLIPAVPETSEDDISKMVLDWFQDKDQGEGGAASQPRTEVGGLEPPTEGPAIPPSFTPVEHNAIPDLPQVLGDIDDAAQQGYTYEAPDPLASYTPEQKQALVGFAQWVAENPDQAQYVDAIMTGRLNPAQLLQQQQPVVQPQPQQQGFQQVAPADPRNPQGQQGLILPQSYQQDIDAVKTVTRALWEERQLTQRQQAQQAYETSVEQFAVANRLSKEQMESLIGKTQSSGMVRALASSGHAPADAIRKAFDYHYATENEFSNHRAALEQARNVEQQRRANKQAALAGSGGNSTRSPVSPAQPTGDRLTEQSRVSNMASFIRQAQGQ